MSAFVPPDFEIVVSPAARPRRGVVMAVAGELDLATAPELEAALREYLAAGAVRLDLRGLSFMSSSGIRVLDAILRDVDAHGWALVIEPIVQPAVRQVIALTGMTDALPFDVPQEAEPSA
ncbi:MAG TPA: STAS domain-containing protein [Solirubrobacteraceae bacterium]|nr:STAS domain-containing protein [Solirubrobacteraceae bacterium]